MICYNGKFQEVMPEKVSPLFDCCQFGHLVFETMRTYQGDEIYELEAHLDRLWESAKILEIDIPYERSEIKEKIKETVKKNKQTEGDLRVKVILCANFYSIVAVPLQKMPEDFYQKGIEITEATFERNFALAKYANPAYKYFMARQPKSCFETIFFNDSGFLREGNISNVFAVFDGVLVTPKNNVLKGVTRTRVLSVAKTLNISVEEREISRKELLLADEIFITNTTKEVVPVRKWNDWNGVSFTLAEQLRENFHSS